MSTLTATHHRARPRGFALPAAIFGLVIVGVLVTGGFYMARQETRIGIASRQATRSFYLAERGLGEVMEDWNATAWRTAADWTTRTFTDTLDEGVWRVQATKMSDWIYFLDGTGTITRGGNLLSGANRRMGIVAKLATAQIDPPAALTTRGDVSIRGGAQVSGFDTNPPTWSTCEAPSDDKTGVLTDLDGSVTTEGGGTVDGDPPTDRSADVTDETFTLFGDLTWAELIELADWRFSGGNFNGMAPSFNADGSCNFADPANWGDPIDRTSACGNYFPMIYVNGDLLNQSNAVGQGILLIEGNADLRGVFIYHGIIITQGNFETQGSGHRIYGAVMASNALLDREKLVGGSIVQNSTCSIETAILLNGALTRLRLLTERSWVDLSNLMN